MTRKRRHHDRQQASKPSSGRRGRDSAIGGSGQASGRGRVALAGLIVLAVAVALVIAGIALKGRAHGTQPEVHTKPYQPRPKGTLTFSKDVAPILFNHCAGCHRPEDAAPFSLLTFEQVSKRARQIADVTASRYMPPWPPEIGYGDFIDERRLTVDELGLLQQWVAEGAIQGNPADVPPPPPASAGWQLGEPDLVVTMPEAYPLPAEGKDIYRNFVFPIPVASTRFVKAVQFKPGTPRVVHHAFIDIDQTRQSRRLAQKQSPPGFDGMDLPDTAVMPAGQLLGWQPGKALYRVPDGLAWILRTNTDLVLQMHMFPSGKPEVIQPSVGFYFTDSAPTNLPFRLRLLYYQLVIPPGDDHYVVEQSYTLPVDVSLLRVNPHAHYLGKDLQGFAVLPSGDQKWLLRIKDWNFNWQGDYQYAQPIELPKGTRLVMRFTYDNSTNNVRNPNQPPKEVRHGINSSDEMAALGFQALAHSAADRDLLGKDYQKYLSQVLVEYFQFLLRRDPNDAQAHTRLASFMMLQGRTAEALDHLKSALTIQPENDQAHYELGYFYLRNNHLSDAWPEFQTVVRLNPQDSQAYGNLGFIALQQRRWQEAQGYFEAALHLNPDDEIAQKNLGLVKAAQQVR